MLAVGFFLAALLYSTVGFGGGSSYLALLALAELPFDVLPKVSLICNLLVVSGGCWHYHKNGNFDRSLILPFVLSSVPMALIGGMYPIREQTFLLLLSSSLVASGVRLLFSSKQTGIEIRRPPIPVAVLVGATLGLLAGLVGLGGGIFLAPLFLNLNWARPKETAAAASSFIFLNSAAGLIGQLTKGIPDGIWGFWPLFLAVILGGQIGSRIGNHPRVSQSLIRGATAVLILIVGGRLLFKLL